MLTTIIIVLLGLALFAYVALPLVLPGGADPLPVERDPVTEDLEEEKDALLRAIRELDAREDLSADRREQLRARYEAKAARVLRALDERRLAGATRPAARPTTRRKLPYATLGLLAMSVAIATTLSAYVLPRVGQDSTVTTFFQEDLDAARGLRDARRAVERDPSTTNLLALADAYWRTDDAENARMTYQRVVEEGEDAPPIAYRRLGFLTLQSDLGEALGHLEQARALAPGDLDTLYAIGEIRFARGELAAAREAWEAYLATAEGEGDPQVAERLRLAEELEPRLARVESDPNRENLLAMADTLWRFEERERAVEVYLRVLTQLDPNDPVALGRTGQLLFLSGRNEDAVALLERAAASGSAEPTTLLFLGNAYYSDEQYEEAADAWELYVAEVGSDRAGRVPSLIEDARARLRGEEPGGGPTAALPVDAAPGDQEGEAAADAEDVEEPTAVGDEAEVVGARVFAENCASCHGNQGGGGMGPRLTGNRRAANESNVENAVRFGRGMMPGFASMLDPKEIEAVVRYVAGTLNGEAGAR